MDEATRLMYLRAGQYYGETTTCRGCSRMAKKIDYGSEEAAVKAAALHSSHDRPLEAYPCTWCDGWHVWLAFTPEEITRFSKEEYYEA